MISENRKLFKETLADIILWALFGTFVVYVDIIVESKNSFPYKILGSMAIAFFAFHILFIYKKWIKPFILKD